MAILKVIFILFVGQFAANVMTAYNPMLSYTMRFQKFSYQSNITGNCTIHKYKEKEFINGYISIKSKDPITKAVVIFTRCNPEGIDCEYFQSWTLTSICSMLKEKTQIWSSWYGSFHPPAICPITTQVFQIINGTIDVGPALKWYPDVTNYYWKVTQKMYTGEQFIGAYTFELSIFGFRKKSKKP